MALTTLVHTQVSSKAQHPYVTGSALPGYKLVGVGAFDNYGTGNGNLLTSMYVDSFAQDFVASGKDHEDASPAILTAYAIGLYDPNNEWEVIVVSATSAKAAHPTATATLPAGYVLTGGGASVYDPSGPGNMLTASFPSSYSSWEARSKDHDLSDPANVTAYAIGIRSNIGREVVGYIASATGTKAAHPTMQVGLPAGYTLTGGGALDNWTGEGNLLTASYPFGNGWIANGKDHIESSPATMTVYAIGLRAM